MARIRSIKPEYWMDRKLARLLSRDQRMLYVGLWNQADEHARTLGDPRVVQGQVFPYEDDLTVDDVDRMLEALAKAGVVVRYTVDEDPYLFLPKLHLHQRLEPDKAKSRHPAPDDPAAVLVASETGDDLPGKSAQNPRENGLLYVTGSMEHVGRGADRAQRLPDDFAPTAELRQWASENTPDVNVNDQTTRFVDYWRGVGGQRGRKLDWPGTWRNWLRKAQDDLPRTRPVDQSVPEAWR